MSESIVVGGGQSAQEFQERMKERMRSAMGDLMPDEVLKDVVEKGIKEAFFTPVPVLNQWGRVERNDPSWCVSFIREECERQVTEAVKDWIKSNPEELKKIVAEQTQNGIAQAVVSAFNRLTSDAMYNLQNAISEVARKLQS